ncbi:MAG: thermonuclease family protein [Acidobacteria bacterium]|nr:thermonuclease family protein [Acidobacteriota bacterium]
MQYKIRFNGIDAPELKQDFGNKSKQNLSDLIFGKEVTAIFNKKDKYGRFVGKIMINGVDANLEQIKAGLAWHYKKYADEQSETDRKAYADAEIAAKEAKKGFWIMPNPIPAWDYRTVTKTKQETEKANRKYLVGAKGGCYYLNSSGNKTYVDKKFCADIPTVVKVESKPEPKSEKEADETKEIKKSGVRTYIKGSHGGCYYMNGDKKVYVNDKSLCGN